jgi:hypothetical protein
MRWPTSKPPHWASRPRFFNPALYAIGKSANYTKCFHDITSGNTTNASSGPYRFLAASGLRPLHRLGQSEWQQFDQRADGHWQRIIFPVRQSVRAQPDRWRQRHGPGDGPADERVQRDGQSFREQPSHGVTASFSAGHATTGTSILTLTAGSTAAAGTSTVTLIGVSGSITQTVALTLTILGRDANFARQPILSLFNVAAIYTDGSTFSGGADGDGNAYSANLLGSALNWDGCLFTVGSANADDASNARARPSRCPRASFRRCKSWPRPTMARKPRSHFIVTYTDGTTSSLYPKPERLDGRRRISPAKRWSLPQAYRNTSGGTKNTVTEAVIYGYSFGLNNTKTVKSIKLPN